MSSSEDGLVNELKAALEDDKRIISALRDEIDRLRFLLGLHSLKKTDANPTSVLNHPPRTKLHPDFSN